MNPARLARSLWRRWYLTIAGLLVTGLLCAFAYVTTSPTLQRSASELLTPATVSIPEGGNPFLYLGGLGQAADVLVRALDSDEVLAPILADHPGTTADVSRDTTTSGPILVLTVTGTKETDVIEVFAAIQAAVPATLRQLQDSAGVPSGARISVLSLTADGKSTVIQKARVETIGFIAAAGIAATLLIVGLVDGLLLARRSSIKSPGHEGKPLKSLSEKKTKPKRTRRTKSAPPKREEEDEPAVLAHVTALPSSANGSEEVNTSARGGDG